MRALSSRERRPVCRPGKFFSPHPLLSLLRGVAPLVTLSIFLFQISAQFFDALYSCLNKAKSKKGRSVEVSRYSRDVCERIFQLTLFVDGAANPSVKQRPRIGRPRISVVAALVVARILLRPLTMGFMRARTASAGPLMILNKRCAVSAESKTIKNCRAFTC